jgi:hypothetical protein
MTTLLQLGTLSPAMAQHLALLERKSALLLQQMSAAAAPQQVCSFEVTFAVVVGYPSLLSRCPFYSYWGGCLRLHIVLFVLR